MELIKGRVRIAYDDYPDKPFFYSGNLSDLRDLNIKHDDNWHLNHIGSKTNIIIDGKKYEVVNVSTAFHDDMQEIVDDYGNKYFYNFEITYYVNSI